MLSGSPQQSWRERIESPFDAAILLVVSFLLQLIVRQHTVSSIAYGSVQCSDKVSHDGIGIVKTSKDRDDVGAWVGVLLSKGGVEEDCQGLSGKRVWPVNAHAVGVPRGRYRRPGLWLALCATWPG